MIGKLIAAREIDRMAGLEYFRLLSAASVNELVKALTYASNEMVAIVVVNEIIAERRDRPTPADIYAAVRIQNEQHRSVMEVPLTRPVYRCKQCQDSGLWGGILAGPDAGEWKSCTCAAGNDPNLYDAIKEANAARNKILASQAQVQRKFGTKRAALPETESSGLGHATRDANGLPPAKVTGAHTAGFQGQGR